jgi:hypothetical protein
MALFSSTWLSFWFPNVDAALKRVAVYLKPNEPTMSYNSERTVELLNLVLETLKSGRKSTADALAAARKATADLEPLRAENSRINTVLADQAALLTSLETQDAAEDAALKAVVDFIETPEETPEDPTPEIPGLGDGPPSTPENPPAEPPVENPPADAGEENPDNQDPNL